MIKSLEQSIQEQVILHANRLRSDYAEQRTRLIGQLASVQRELEALDASYLRIDETIAIAQAKLKAMQGPSILQKASLEKIEKLKRQLAEALENIPEELRGTI